MNVKILIAAVCISLIGCGNDQPNIVYVDGEKQCKKIQKINVMFTPKGLLPIYTEYCDESENEKIHIH